NGFSGSSGKNLVSQTDNSARWDNEFTYHPFTFAFHTDHFAFSDGDHIYCGATHGFWQVNGHFFKRFAFYSINFLDDYLRLTNLKFVTFTTHGFYQDRQVKYPATKDHKFIGTIGRLHS